MPNPELGSRRLLALTGRAAHHLKRARPVRPRVVLKMQRSGRLLAKERLHCLGRGDGTDESSDKRGSRSEIRAIVSLAKIEGSNPPADELTDKACLFQIDSVGNGGCFDIRP